MKEFKNLRDNITSQAELSNDYSWENMRTGIQNKIDILDKENSKSRSPLFYLGLLSLVIGILGILFFTIISTKDSPDASEQNEIFTLLNNSLQNPNIVEIDVVNKPEVEITQLKADIHKGIIYPHDCKELEEATPNQNTLATVNPKTAVAGVDAEMVYSNSFSVPNSPLIAADIVESNDIRQEQQRPVAFFGLSKQTFSALKFQRAKVDIVPAIHKTEILQNNTGSNYFLSIGIGANIWNANYTNSSVKGNKKAFEKNVVGETFSLGLRYQKYNNWSISSNISYAQLYTRLDAETTVRVSGYRKDVVTEVIVNYYNRDTTYIRGSGVVNVDQQWEVRNYNRFKQLSIPLLIAYNARYGNWNFLLGGGSQLSFLLRQEGRIAQGNNLENFDNNNPIYNKSLNIGLASELGLQYLFKQKYFIGASLAYTQSLGNWNIENDISVKPRIFNAQLKTGIRL